MGGVFRIVGNCWEVVHTPSLPPAHKTLSKLLLCNSNALISLQNQINHQVIIHSGFFFTSLPPLLLEVWKRCMCKQSLSI
ncbi:hypothetical protein Pfo_027409 [Paulownia fortunei]|nr:hypothetical protein Pfo_027409 [Paulownia fortunei]